MAQPWLKYQSTPQSSPNPGPWAKYQSTPDTEAPKPEEPGMLRELADTTADYLPEIGGMAGGIAGGVGAGPAGAIGGSAAGGALGKAGQDLYNKYMRPELAPKEDSEYLTGPLKEGAYQGVLGGIGESIPLAAKAVARTPVGKAIGETLSPVGKFIADKAKGAIGKLGSLATGVEDGAMVRQLERPTQTAAMEGEDAVYNLGKKGLSEIEAKGNELGKNVGEARWKLINSEGTYPIAQAERDKLAAEGEQFLKRNRPSQSGYSAITPEQAQEFSGYLNDIKSGTVEDFVKMREQFDHIEGLAKQYGSSTLTPYQRELMSLRGKMNDVLKATNPEFKGANEAFSDFTDKKSLLGLGNESKAESVFNNLYGANKTSKQKAAEGILSPDTFEAAKDIAANKSFSKAQGPFGSDIGQRKAIGLLGAVPTAGLSMAITSPSVWKNGLRGLGKAGQALGTYGPILEQAAARSPQALSSTVQILMKTDPEFKKRIEQIEQDIETPLHMRTPGSLGE